MTEVSSIDDTSSRNLHEVEQNDEAHACVIVPHFVRLHKSAGTASFRMWTKHTNQETCFSASMARRTFRRGIAMCSELGVGVEIAYSTIPFTYERKTSELRTPNTEARPRRNRLFTIVNT